MTEEYRVRPAHADDAEGFVRAHEAAWNATAGEIVGRSLEELMPFDARVARNRAPSISHASDDARAWVAEHSRTIVGIAVCRREGDAVELRDLYVDPGAWGTGVAKMLLDAALDGMRGGAEAAFLWVGQANLRARRFYEREGWVEDGTTRESPLGPVELRYSRVL